MALPVVKYAQECANYYSTFEPYLYQLRPFTKVVLEAITSPTALKQVYLDTNPAITALAFSIAISPLFLLVAEINQNFSQVDRCWSLLPTVYISHYATYAHLAGLETQRMDALLIASMLWSTRLTFNYWRKGGYTVGSEDYRWEIVKNYVGQPLFFIFDILFISSAQSLLLYIVSLPAYALLLTCRLATAKGQPAIEFVDYIGAGAMVTFVILSFVADGQQWDFQTAKHKYRETAKLPRGTTFTAKEFDRGFLTKGLFAYSRHPNFLFEQSVWVTLFLWSCAICRTAYNWTGIGALAYLFLFQASTWLTELLTSGKYPEYKEYQKHVGMFLPKPWAGPPVFETKRQMISSATHASPSSNAQNEADYAQAKERYDLR